MPANKKPKADDSKDALPDFSKPYWAEPIAKARVQRGPSNSRGLQARV